MPAAPIRTTTFAVLLALFLLAAPGGPARAACTAPAGAASEIVYNSSGKIFQYCDGAAWVRMNRSGSGSGGCALVPSGSIPEGEFLYHTDHRILTGCAGNVQRAMGPMGGKHRWVQISASNVINGHHVCGIRSDGALYCWGENGSGRLGVGDTVSRNVPTKVSGVWKYVNAGGENSCGIKSDGTLWCWGRNNNGQLGDGTTSTRTTPVPVSGGGTWKALATGLGHTCAIKSDDSLWCWGSNSVGQLGLGATGPDQLTPVAVPGGGTWKQIAVATDGGGPYSCGIKSDDMLWCWGRNNNGQLGDNSTTDRHAPVPVSGGGTWTLLKAGGQTTCAIKSDDTLWCWGGNGTGQTGTGGTSNRIVPTAVSGGGAWKAVGVGYKNTCAIKADDSLWCWGDNGWGQLGNATPTFTSAPSAVTGGGAWKAATGGHGFSCGIRTDDTLWCWGSNEFGQMGDGADIDNPLPRPLPTGGLWKAVSGSANHACAIKSDDTLWCWGGNGSGQTGDGTFVTPRPAPVQVSGGGAWKVVSVNSGVGTHSCGIKSDDTLRCWGDKTNGQVGDGTSGGDRLVPTAVSGGGTWKKVSVGASYTCGIKSDATLWCWGWNADGRTGLNTAAGNTLVPTQVTGGGSWVDVAAGGDTANAGFTCAIKADRSLWCWGDNSFGQLGDGTSGTDRLVPTAVSGGGAWEQVDVGAANACGIKSDDTLWCWGANGSGQLGDGTTTSRTVPTAVSGGGAWEHIGTGSVTGSFGCGIKSDGTLWCWGGNGSGQLGDGTFVNHIVPAPIAGGGTWRVIAAEQGFACAIGGPSLPGPLYCWGKHWHYNQGVTAFSGDRRPFPYAVPCARPKGEPGALVYNVAFNVMQYCDGVDWVPIGKQP